MAGNNHRWMKEEEQCLLDPVEKDEKEKHFGNSHFCRYLAGLMNDIFGKKNWIYFFDWSEG